MPTTLQIGAVFPQTEIGADPVAIREYAEAVEAMNFSHILAYDHVLGADTASRPGWSGPYTSETLFHEVFTLFGYLAALTRRVELVTGVVILPQRQTALVAKQAAEVDVLSGGRFRLGIGVGWNPVEYEGLNEDFHTRGARSAEQIEVLKALFTRPVVTYQGQWHHIVAAGINPLPVRRPIPIWLGGHADQTLRRTARLGDGWLPQLPPGDEARELVTRLREYTRAAGRPESAVGIEARLTLARTPEAGWARYAEAWHDLGATHLTINTMGAGHTTVQAHLDALRQAKDTLGV
ncbi:MAG: LLM class F420-dependent oxidoreductase [Ktedonobacterales bacterium]|nr:LLM class F420-dependent oxidoreductase [Ktedonobacterales bacterium]